VGCTTATGALQCTSVSGADLCVRSCSTTDDCPDAFSTCQPLDGGNACLFDSCGSNYGGCDSEGSDDGICLPDTTGGTCLQDGSQADQASCSTTRGSQGAVSQLCVSGEFCIPGAVGSTTGVCEQLCAATGSGPSCSGNDFCWAPDPGSFDWGVCLISCTGNELFSNCPSGKYCLSVDSQGDMGCLP
jgi:hypothetical protein